MVRFGVVILAWLLCLWPTLAASQAYAYAPAELATLVRALADPDAETRDAAREALMGLKPPDLPALRRAAEALSPLPTPVGVTLEDVVIHVHMAGGIQEQGSASGFLGVSAPADDRFPQARFGDPLPQGQGAFVNERIRGFVAYRMLRDGDLIVGIEAPGLNVIVRDFVTLSQVIPNLRPGVQVTLRVRRGAEVRPVPVRLDPNIRQRFADPATFDAFMSRLEREAAAYWDNTFAPALAAKPEDAAARLND